MTEPESTTTPLSPEIVSAILRDPDSPLYPAQIGVFCDDCGAEEVHDFMVGDDMDRDARFAVARAHLASVGWKCDALGDLCPSCTPAAASVQAGEAGL